MTGRRVALFWCCIPLVIASCGDESTESTLPATSPPAATTTTTLVAAKPPTSRPASTAPKPPEDTMPTTDRPSAPEPSNSSTPSMSAPPTTASTASNLEIATTDLRTRVGAGVDIEVVSRAQVTWPNGALGCPEPGMSYTQALVDGERIVLRADGVDFEYHSGKNRPAFYCPPGRVKPPTSGDI